MNLVTVLLVILLLIAIGGAPTWGFHTYGWGPSSVLGAFFIALIVLLILGKI